MSIANDIREVLEKNLNRRLTLEQFARLSGHEDKEDAVRVNLMDMTMRGETLRGKNGEGETAWNKNPNFVPTRKMPERKDKAEKTAPAIIEVLVENPQKSPVYLPKNEKQPDTLAELVAQLQSYLDDGMEISVGHDTLRIFAFGRVYTPPPHDLNATLDAISYLKQHVLSH
jgi:hypothetical protein